MVAGPSSIGCGEGLPILQRLLKLRCISDTSRGAVPLNWPSEFAIRHVHHYRGSPEVNSVVGTQHLGHHR